MGPKVTLLKEGIVVINYGDDCHFISYKRTRELVDLGRKEITDYLPHIERFPLLILAKNLRGMSRSAINLIHGEEVCSLINSSSYLSDELADSIIKRAVIRMYLWSSPPPYPFKVSRTRAQAIEWLCQYVPDNFTEEDYQTYLSHKREREKLTKAS